MTGTTTHSKSILISTLLAAAIASLFNGCKLLNEEDSKTSSVDNLVAGGQVEFALNECTSSGNNLEKGMFLFQRSEDDPTNPASKESKRQVVEGIVAKNVKYVGNSESDAIKTAITDVLNATPMDVLLAFRLTHAGHENNIYIYDTPPPACNSKEKNTGNTANEFVPFSCYGMKGEGGKDAPGVHIGTGKIARLDGTQKDVSIEQAVRHGLLKATIFYFTFVLKAYAESPNTPGPNSEPILALGTKLEDALKKDLSDKNAVGKVGATWDSVKATPDLKWVIMSHVLDSAFCSETSRQILAACYPNTFQTFRTDGGATNTVKITPESVNACLSSRQQLVAKTWGI